MFTRANRLSKTKDVELVMKRGQSFFSPHFVIKHLKQASGYRLTVVVSTKVSKSAVKRNRIKRVLRDELRNNLKRLKPGDYALIVKPAAAKLESVLLRQQMMQLLQKVRLLNYDTTH